MTTYTKFDIPLYSGRQVWWEWSRSYSPEKTLVRVQTSGGRILPRYEKGIGTVINGLSPLYQDIGNYLWSEQVELDEGLRLNKERNLYCYLTVKVRAQERRQDWKANTERLMRLAIKDCRHNNQVESRQGKLYTNEQLGDALKCSEDAFRVRHIEKWNFLKDTLTGWLNAAEQPLYDWMRKVKDGV